MATAPALAYTAGPCPPAAVQELLAIDDRQRADRQHGSMGGADLEPEVETTRRR